MLRKYLVSCSLLDVHAVIMKNVEDETKSSTFGRHCFQMHFLNENNCILIQNVTEFDTQGSTN